jgi:hypothetical protein
VLGLQPIEDQELSGGLIKLAISGIFFSFSADYAAESHRGCHGRVLSLPGLLYNKTRAPSTCKTRVHCRCVSAEGKQPCPPPRGVEVIRPALWAEGRRWRAGTGRDLDWKEDAQRTQDLQWAAFS